MLSFARLCPLPAAALLAVACSGTPLDPRPGPVDPPRFASDGTPGPEAVASVTGHFNGTLQRPAAGDILIRQGSFSAHLLADGTVRGEIEVVLRTGPPSALEFEDHEEVTCLHVRGSQAWIGAVVTRSTDLPVGREFVWHVIDNGRNPDQVQRNLLPADTCVLEPPVVPLVTFRHGDLTIHDRR